VAFSQNVSKKNLKICFRFTLSGQFDKMDSKYLLRRFSECLLKEWRTQGAKVVKGTVYHLGEKAISSCGYAAWCAGAIQGKDGRIQVLAGLAPSSQTVGSNKRVIREQAKPSS